MYDLRDYVDTNVTGTAALLEALIKRKQPLARLALSSSRAVYGEGACRCPSHGAVHPAPRMREDMEQGRFDLLCPRCGEPLIPAPTDEDQPLSPLSVYAWTKKEQEELCRYAARTFGIPATILRYFNVYGPGQSLKNPYTGVVSIFFSRIMSGQPISLYEHGKPIRDFVHVSDVARANVAALESDVAPGACINVGTGCAVTIADVARGLAAACGREVEFVDRGEFRVGDIYSCYADIARARRLLGYGPSAGLAEGLESFATWARGEEWVDLYQRSVDELRQHDLMGEAGRRTS
jgi:dTDP-L-rhamnose 4-epimerase